MADRLIPYFVRAIEYDQTEEDALATTLLGASATENSIFIYNTTLSKARRWNGSAFVTVPYCNSDGSIGGGYDGNPATINQDATHRFATDTEKNTWNAKADALGADDNYATDAEKTKLSNLSGTNTGDQDLSGKQATLVSGTNIKTVNSSSILGSGNIVVAGDPLPGTIVLLSSDETDSAETASSTNETAALKTYTLAANSYTSIKIEAIVRSRNDADLAADPVYTWRIKEAGATVRTFTHTNIGITTTGIDGGDTHVSTLSVIIAGGQGGNTALTITGQMSDSNSAMGVLVHAFRVYGIV